MPSYNFFQSIKAPNISALELYDKVIIDHIKSKNPNLQAKKKSKPPLNPSAPKVT